MMQVAVIGLGWWGNRICDSLEKSGKLKVVRGMDIVPAVAAQVGDARGFPTGDRYADVLADASVQGVIIVTPPSGHEEQVLAAAAAGKHVLCEKPFSLTEASAARMVAACHAAGVQLGIDHERRWEPAMEEVQRLVGSGELGEILHWEGHHSHAWMLDLPEDHWRRKRGEGPSPGFTGMGIHILDLMTHMLGRPTEVMAWIANRSGGFAAGDVYQSQLRYADGTTASLANVCATPFHVRLAVFGSKGWVQVQDVDLGEGKVQSTQTVSMIGATPQVTTYEPIDSVLLAAEAWRDSALEGAPYRFSDAELVSVVATEEALQQSIDTGGPAPVAPASG